MFRKLFRHKTGKISPPPSTAGILKEKRNNEIRKRTHTGVCVPGKCFRDKVIRLYPEHKQQAKYVPVSITRDGLCEVVNYILII